MNWPILISAVVALAAFSYTIVLVMKAWSEVKTSPREAMIFCPKHGPIREQYTIDFLGTKNCAICFHDRLKLAEKGKLV